METESKPSDKLILVTAILVANVSQLMVLPIWGKSRGLFIALLLISLGMRSWKTIACTLVFALMSLYSRFIPSYLASAPIIGFLIPFLIAAALLLLFPKTRLNLQWMRKGKIDRMSWILILVTSFCSTIALVLWAFWTGNLGLGADVVRGFGNTSKLMIALVYIPIFAFLNAFAEEVVYRGLIQESLTRVFRSPALILLLQASAFAAVHFAGGFPNGPEGYLMVLVYGTMLGYLRMRTKGLLAPYLAHVIADATIGILLIVLVRQGYS